MKRSLFVVAAAIFTITHTAAPCNASNTVMASYTVPYLTTAQSLQTKIDPIKTPFISRIFSNALSHFWTNKWRYGAGLGFLALGTGGVLWALKQNAKVADLKEKSSDQKILIKRLIDGNNRLINRTEIEHTNYINSQQIIQQKEQQINTISQRKNHYLRRTRSLLKQKDLQEKNAHIDISKTGITDSGLQNILHYCPTLKKLSAGYCTELLFENLNWEKLEELCYLDLSDTKINDQGLQDILDHCVNLVALRLRRCINLDFRLVDWAKQNKLIFLSLSHTKITGQQLSELLKNTPKLSSLNLKQCVNLPKEFQIFHKGEESIRKLQKMLNEQLQQSIKQASLIANNKRIENNERALILQVPRDCWEKIGAFIADNQSKLDLRITCKDFSVLFNGTEDFPVPAILFKNIPLKVLGPIAKNRILRDRVVSFVKSCNIDSIVLSIENLSIAKLLKPYIKKVSLLERQDSKEMLQNAVDNCPHLTKLNIDWEKPDMALVSWKNLQELSRLKISGDITDSSLSDILKHCPNLTKLNLGYSYNLTNFALTKNPKLTSLDLSFTQISTESLQKALDSCPDLTKLILPSGDTLNLEAIDWKNQKNLICLEFRKITSKGLQNILNNCPNLTLLTGKLKDVDNAIDWKNQKQLKNLTLKGSAISDRELQNILTHCTSLSGFDVSNCEKLTFDNLNWDKCKNLTSLILDNTHINAQALQNILTHVKNLSILFLSDCSAIKFKDLNWKPAQSLRVLNLTNTTTSNRELFDILNSCPSILALRIEGCINLAMECRNLINNSDVEDEDDDDEYDVEKCKNLIITLKELLQKKLKEESQQN